MRVAHVLVVASLALACSAEPPGASASREQEAAIAPEAGQTSPVAIDASDLPPPRTAELESPAAAELASPEPESASPESASPESESAESAEPESVPEPDDPLAPIMPSGPEPGSPESDAELAALLDESTITQDEFDEAFRNSGPNVRGDQLVFGGGRRQQSVVNIGSVRVVEGQGSTAEIQALARADERRLIGCHVLALAKDPNASGSVTLRLRFDGATVTVEHQGGGALGSALIECLEAAAKTWRPAKAGKLSVEIPLTLTTE